MAQDIYAIIQTGGKQYRVEPGSEILIDRLDGETGTTIALPILFLRDKNAMTMDASRLKSMSIGATIVGHTMGEKVNVLKYKSKARYRKRTGFRPKLTKIKIEAFGVEPVAKIAQTTKATKKPAETKTRTAQKKVAKTKKS